jgi:hypothetical protein
MYGHRVIEEPPSGGFCLPRLSPFPVLARLRYADHVDDVRFQG